MPELPDIVVYIDCLQSRIEQQVLEKIRIASPFVLRSIDPPTDEAEGRKVVGIERIGKRIVLCLEDALYVVVHLMIAGRLQWKTRGAKVPGKLGLAAFDFPTGTLILTEAGHKKRASITLLRGASALGGINPGGIEPLEIDLEAFRSALLRENHTLKRALTDPRILSGIGNAYSDEILHRARLSPIKLTSRLSEVEVIRLYQAVRQTLTEWIDRLRQEVGDRWPKKVTAFREEMAVHGRYGKPCPDCGAPVQRIVYADNETNYCARCQTGGRLLADRALSRLLKGDWPRRLDDLEEKPDGV
jgi:formamidopyrimidine-DNA glycosylase